MGESKQGGFAKSHTVQTLEGVFQSPLWWAGASGGILGKVYPQNSHHQTPRFRDDRQAAEIQIQGLCRWQQNKGMCLSHEEFLRRFEQHILPRGFVKIRHGGFLRCRDKHQRITMIRQSMKLGNPMPRVKIPLAVRMLEKYGMDINLCPCCKIGSLVTIKDTRAEWRERSRPRPSHGLRTKTPAPD